MPRSQKWLLGTGRVSDIQENTMSNSSRRGSLWNKWDLHFHTPSSFDYPDKTVTNQQLVDCLVRAEIRVVAITDHHRIDVVRVNELQALSADQLTILPGIELRDDHGGKPIHYICIFPEDCDLHHVWTTLQGRLGLTPRGIEEKGGDEKVYVPIEEGAREARKLGGVVSIHAGAKSNSIENISNQQQFQQRIKYDITKDFVDLMEIGQIKDVERHLATIFPSTGLDKPLILCSDNHTITEYTTKGQLWFRADPTFRGLLMVLREPRDRVFIGAYPPQLARVKQNPTKYIRQVSFHRLPSAPVTGTWFSGTIRFNPGLVAIIGNKGSGKSALADTLALLGATRNADSFSFLNGNRFRHPTEGFADFFEATLEWESDEKVRKSLAATIGPEEVERLRYLPQGYVEKVCNEFGRVGEARFEHELKAVIFDHVPKSRRLGYSTLDDLVRFQTEEKQKRIDSLIKELRESSRIRATLESRADPDIRKAILEKIKQRRLELEAHKKIKPPAVADPALRTDSGLPGPDAALLEGLSTAVKAKKLLESQIHTASQELARAERRLAVATRLLDRLDNFRKDFEAFTISLRQDATELGLAVEELVVTTIRKTAPENALAEAGQAISKTVELLDGAEPPGLRSQLAASEHQILELQSQLDAPHRAYQAYLTALGQWRTKLQSIEGTDSEPESLRGLELALASLDQLPDQIDSARARQRDLAIQIHDQKLSQAEVYRKLYEPVQNFIDSHVLAKDKLQLEFRVELRDEDFAGRLLSLLALNRRGSFMGIDEGREKAQCFVQATRWEDSKSLCEFLDNVDRALHTDQRTDPVADVHLKDQLAKSRKAEEVFDMLYSLEYIRPRYILRWEGKDLSVLSPGERGALLLVFYLLIDRGDVPLVIDQPEGNLDNNTVAKVLVECIKEVKKHRQVFIVTHNPNLAVVCDADQVVHATMDKARGNAVTYTSGALENPVMSQYVTDVLEGTRWAFGVRRLKYGVCD